jgi:ribonucleoside-triphosphate reductase
MRGLIEICPECGSENVSGITRVVGYFSEIKNMNKSKQKEISQRQLGNYSMEASIPDKEN